MKTLIIAATKQEIQPLLTHFKVKEEQEFFKINEQLSCLITGIGAASTTFQLTQCLLQNQFNFVIQAGIAGSFNQEIKLGELVQVTEEQFGDLGAEDPEGNFLTLQTIHLDVKTKFTNSFKLQHVRETKGLTVNTVSGSKKTIVERQKFKVDIESMEGAALFLVCENLNVKFTELRAISNYVEPRNRANWKIKQAINTLNKYLIDLLTNP